jgi:hypothetical protein
MAEQGEHVTVYLEMHDRIGFGLIRANELW